MVERVVPEIVVRRADDVRIERDVVIVPPLVIDYKSKLVVELKAIAKSKGLTGYSTLRKAELIEFLKKHH